MSVDAEVQKLIDASVAAAVAPLDARLDALEHAAPEPPDPEPEPEPEPIPPVPEPLPTGLHVLGVAFAAMDKANRQIGEGAHAIRFRARHGGKVKSFAFQATNRAEPYGAGDGGKYNVSIQGVNDKGFPTGTALGGTAVWDPVITANPQNFPVKVQIAEGPTLERGKVYAAVVKNIGTNPSVNRTSLNYPWLSGGPRQPFWDDATVCLDGAKPYRTPLDWAVNLSVLPAFDLEYTDGKHEGAGGIRGVEQSDRVGLVSSTCRWTFQHKGPAVSVDAVCARFLGTGSPTGVLLIGGVEKARATMTKSGIWHRGEFPKVSIAQGASVEVRFSGTGQTMPLMFWQDAGSNNKPERMLSYPYDADGTNPHRAYDGGGAVWGAWEAHTSFQAYLEVA